MVRLVRPEGPFTAAGGRLRSLAKGKTAIKVAAGRYLSAGDRTLSGVYKLNPDEVGQVDNYANWLRSTAILDARLFKISVQVDF